MEDTLRMEQFARWLSVDPLAKKYPSHSPYNFVVNSPLMFIDPDGRDVKFAKGQGEKEKYDDYRGTVKSRMSNLNAQVNRAIERGKNRKVENLKAELAIYTGIDDELNQLEASEDVFRIRMGGNVSSSAGGGNTRFNPDTAEIDVNIGGSSSFSTVQRIAHELMHVFQFLDGRLDFRTTSGGPGLLYDRGDEREAFYRQNLFYSVGQNGGGYIDDVTGFVNDNYSYIKQIKSRSVASLSLVNINGLPKSSDRDYYINTVKSGKYIVRVWKKF